MIDWIKTEYKQPPIGEYVLTAHGNSNYPTIQTDRLNFGGKYNYTPDDGLLYWDSGADYGEVTHWAELPNIPNAELVE